MREEILVNIRKLIEDRMGKYKFPLNKEVSLEKDLGMSGDDAVEFILEYSKYFKVDISEFVIGKYFEPEGDGILSSLRKVQKTKELTIGHLEKGALMGKLNEEIIDAG